MDALIEKLRSQGEGLDAGGVTPPPASLPTVVKRGRRYAAATMAMTVLGASGAFAAVAVVAPAVIERFEENRTPVVMDMPDGEEAGDGAVEDGEGDELLPPVDDAAPAEDDEAEGEADADVEVVADEPKDEDADTGAEVDTTAPALAVTSPADGANLDDKTVRFSGTVEPGSRVKVGQYEADVADDGTWSIVLIASSGTNTVTFRAYDAAGNVTEVVHRVVYTPTATDRPKDDGGALTLTANQQHRKLTSSPYRNVYWGTAPAGAKVAVTSEHGTDYAWADDAGEWEVAVTFTPPSGTTTFGVKVKLYEHPDIRRSFELTTVKDTVDVAFTANQQKAQLTGAPYTNVYWGTTTPGTKIKVWSDHGWDYTYADDNGDWELAVTFEPPPGTTSFPVTARHYHDGNVSRTFTLTTVAPEAEPFTANQQHASVPASAPTNRYSGTGEPGHEVWIWTESHGQWWTTIREDGTWSIEVTFAEVAPGQTFDVKAKDTWTGEKQYFSVSITG